jgi:hypothetical protein
VDDQLSPDVTAPGKPAVRNRKMLLALVIVVGLILAGLILPSPFGPPATLHVWGKDFDSTGQPACEDLDPSCLGHLFAPIGPSPATPMAAEAMRQDAEQMGLTPVVLHLQPGILGWMFGATDAEAKPSQRTEPVFLQVGPDAFIPYLWARCCMPDW